MSDQPLFQNMDEQEAVYDPQQRGGDDAPNNANANDTTDAVGVPAAGAGLLGLTGGGAGTGVVGGSPGATGSVVGGAASEDETAGDRSV